jgi:hypothetical protein
MAVAALENVAAAQGASVPTAVIAESAERWRGAAESVRRRILQNSDDWQPEDDERLTAAGQRAVRATQRLVQAGILDESETGATAGGAEEAPLPDDRSFFRGAANELHVSWSQPQAAPVPWRSVAAWCIAVSALLLWPVNRSARARSWLNRHAHLAVAAAGLMWWLMAPLGWLGWLLVLAAAWQAVRVLNRTTGYETASTPSHAR